MSETLVLTLAAIPILGIVAQWVAWRFRLPSIMVLLVAGILFGPVLGFLHPDEQLGPVLLPLVQLAVAIILFEGGLQLRFSDLKNIGKAVRNLVIVGTFVTWIAIAFGAHYFLGLQYKLAILLGAILVVTGPTVVLPLLKYVKPKKHIASILRWEGIVIDPIGAILAVLVFEAITVFKFNNAVMLISFSLFKTIFFGIGLAVLGGILITEVIKRHWAPEHLYEAITLSVVIGVYIGSNFIKAESGLLAVTCMGIFMANQKVIPISSIVTFKKTLAVLLLSTVFIILAARLEIGDLARYLNMNSFWFLVVVVFVARPLAVIVSTIGTSLKWRSKLFIAWMAPRGIVAAAVTAVFALRLEEMGFVDAKELVPITFLVIIATVSLYGLTAFWVARALGVMTPKKKGLLIVGANKISRMIAKALIEEDIPVLMVDKTKDNVFDARSEGLPVVLADVLSSKVMRIVESSNLEKLLAMTPNDEINLLASMEFESIFGKRRLYRFSPDDKQVTKRAQHYGRIMFGSGITYGYLTTKLIAGVEIKKFDIIPGFTYKRFIKEYPKAIPLFCITSNKKLLIFSKEVDLQPVVGNSIISLI